MRRDAPTLAPTFRSQLQGDLLAVVLLAPEQEWTISDLARRLGAPLTSVQNEVSRLIGADILTSRKIGRARLVRANRDSPAVAPLTQLTLVTFGPHVVVADEFADLGADRVLVFGSWAARYHNEPGPSPQDLDVLVVGIDVDRAAMYEAAERAEGRLHLPVNPVLRTPHAWGEPETDPLLSDIMRRPYVTVIGDPP
ncbi:MAG: ArsR family transcriptional regulator [Actinophytocola sp.]|nr:ArsR family transcriptional regulator [Actinophytocola sp.]